jgi:hypothetical protein
VAGLSSSLLIVVKVSAATVCGSVPACAVWEVCESAKAGQHAVSQALHEFRLTIDEAIPEAVQPIRTRIVDAAIELADELVTAQFNFHRSIVRSADRALTKSNDQAGVKSSRGHD